MKANLMALILGLGLSAKAQMTSYFGMYQDGAERGLEILKTIPDSACSWKKGPEKGVRPEKLSPEVMNFVGSRTGPKVKLICRGTVVCETADGKYQSDNFMVCGMRGDDCKPKDCWAQFLNDKISFLNQLPSSGKKTPATESAQGSGRD